MQVIATCCAKRIYLYLKRFDQLEALVGFLFASNTHRQQRKKLLLLEYVKMRLSGEEQ